MALRVDAGGRLSFKALERPDCVRTRIPSGVPLLPKSGNTNWSQTLLWRE